MTLSKLFSIQDVYRIQNKRIKTYRKIGSFFFDISRRYQKEEIKEDYLTSNIKKDYGLDPRTIKKYIGQYIFNVSRKNIFIFTKEDIILIDQTIGLYKDYMNLPEGRKKMIKFLIYFLLEQSKQGQK